MKKKTMPVWRLVIATSFLVVFMIFVATGCKGKTGNPDSTNGPSLPVQQNTEETTQKNTENENPTETMDYNAGVGERDDYGDETSSQDSDTTIEQDHETQADSSLDVTEPTKEQSNFVPTQTEPGKEVVLLTYEQYEALSADEQEAYCDTFPSLKEFIKWFNAAKAAYEGEKEVEEMDGTIHIGD